MKKNQLDTSEIISELKQGSVFFRKEEIAPKLQEPGHNNDHETKIPRNHDTTASRYHDTIIENIRKAVKVYGKEAATHRFTVEEKQALDDLEYTYRRKGIRTSENEISRIAVNFIIKDHAENGENSVLALVLKALNE